MYDWSRRKAFSRAVEPIFCAIPTVFLVPNVWCICCTCPPPLVAYLTLPLLGMSQCHPAYVVHVSLHFSAVFGSASDIVQAIVACTARIRLVLPLLLHMACVTLPLLFGKCCHTCHPAFVVCVSLCCTCMSVSVHVALRFRSACDVPFVAHVTQHTNSMFF